MWPLKKLDQLFENISHTLMHKMKLKKRVNNIA